MRVAFYGRVSTEEQADRGNIKNQVEFAEKYFRLNGSVENIDDYEMYLDEGVSGTIPLKNRPEGGRLLNDVREGRMSVVYFFRLDRLARSTREVLEIYTELERLNVSIKSMTEAFETCSPVGKFFMTLLAGIAALERDTILERTLMGKERKALDGCWTSGPPPFGYRIGADKRLVVYEPEAETVRLIFRLYSGGMSMVPLAEYLNKKGIPTPKVSKSSKNNSTGLWHAGHISVILKSFVYTGKYQTMRRSKGNKNGLVFAVPAIVPPDLFDRIKIILRQNRRVSSGQVSRRSILRGVIYCGHCGYAMVGSGYSNNGRFYYRCTGTINHGRGKSCSNRQIRETDIIQPVWKDILCFIKKSEIVSSLIEKRFSRDTKAMDRLEKELVDVEQSVLEKKNARAKILSLLARSLMTDREAERELDSLAVAINLLFSRRDSLLVSMTKEQKVNNQGFSLAAIMEKLTGKLDCLEPDGRVIRLLVKRVEVKTEELDRQRFPRVSVYYRFKDFNSLF